MRIAAPSIGWAARLFRLLDSPFLRQLYNYRFVTTAWTTTFPVRSNPRALHYNSQVGIDNSATLAGVFPAATDKFHLVTITSIILFPDAYQRIRVGFNRFAQAFTSGSFAFPGLDSFPNLQLNDLGQLQVGPDPNAPNARRYLSGLRSGYLDQESAYVQIWH